MTAESDESTVILLTVMRRALLTAFWTQKILLTRDGVLVHPNNSVDDCGTDVVADIEQHNRIEYPEFPEMREMSTTPNVPRLIRPSQKSQRQAVNVLITSNAIETRKNKGVKKR
jgi:hypothetical protein